MLTVTDRSGKVCGSFAASSVVAVCGNPEEGVNVAEVFLTTGARVELHNVVVKHVIEALHPSAPASRSTG